MREAIENLTSTLDRSTSKRRSRHEAGSARKRSREGEGFDPTEALESLHSSSSSEQGVSDAVEEDDLPPSIFDENESKGPEVSEALAKRVNEAFTVKPLEGKMKLLMDKYKTPSNCELMCVPRVNTTLWNELPRKAHQIDLGLQEAQKAIVKTGQIVVQITDDMLKAKKNKEHLKPSKFSFFTAQNLVNLDEGTTTRDTTKVQPKQELIKIGKHPRQINNPDPKSVNLFTIIPCSEAPSCDTSVAITGVVSSGSTNAHRSSNSPAQLVESSSTSAFRSATSSTRPASTCRLDSVRNRLHGQGVSEGATKVICESWTKGTKKQYEPAWSKWESWCCERSVDPFQAPINIFLNFLNQLYDEGKAYSTINTYRSAVSSTVEAVTGINVGCHHLVSRFMKGVFVGLYSLDTLRLGMCTK
ncbi:hypothetical protein AC249_AIPGENE25302 [Exaiptasia diaphana]|nr:hypothetical protein AC249_AIPGENE25302 [Exaiptasia diaphana]